MGGGQGEVPSECAAQGDAYSTTRVRIGRRRELETGVLQLSCEFAARELC